jgi:hypothetical protein
MGTSSVVDDMEKAILTLRCTERNFDTPPPTTEYQSIWDSQTTSVTSTTSDTRAPEVVEVTDVVCESSSGALVSEVVEGTDVVCESQML